MGKNKNYVRKTMKHAISVLDGVSMYELKNEIASREKSEKDFYGTCGLAFTNPNAGVLTSLSRSIKSRDVSAGLGSEGVPVARPDDYRVASGAIAEIKDDSGRLSIQRSAR